FVAAVAAASDDAAKLAALEASGLAECVAGKRNDLAAAFGKISAALGCEADNTQAGCGVTFRYIVQIYRDNPPDDVFVQTATAAALIRAEFHTRWQAEGYYHLADETCSMGGADETRSMGEAEERRRNNESSSIPLQ